MNKIIKKSFVTSLIALITWFEIFIFSFIITLSLYIATPISTKKTIFIPSRDTKEIISHLSKKGYKLSSLDGYILDAIGKKPIKGWLFIGKKRLSRLDFLHKIVSPSAHINKIRLIPGETLYVFLKELSLEYDYDLEKLNRYYKQYSDYKEAGILPDTYFVPYGIGEKNLMKFLVNLSDKKYKKISYKYYNDYNTTKFNKILTMASIIQKEAGSNKEMPIVSSVIHNRLKKRMRLQMDGTLNYGKYSHIKVTPKRIDDDNTTYNTYKHYGLPKYPISSASITAIKSAINPKKTDYLYFMLNKNGYHDFSKTYRQHRKYIHNTTEK